MKNLKSKFSNLIILIGIILFTVSSCSDDSDTNPKNAVDQPIPVVEDPINSYPFKLDDSPEFQIGSSLPINYFNDITVGVLNYTSNNIKLITASGTQTLLLEGENIENIDKYSVLVTPSSDPESFYHDYIGLGQLIKDRNGKIYSLFHAEWHDGTILPGNIPGFYASIGLATSIDGGITFQINETPVIPNIYDKNHDNGWGDGGLGEPSITFNKDSTSVYVYYVDHNRTGRGVNICMSKFDVSTDGVPDFNSCYFLNSSNIFSSTLQRSKEIVYGENFKDAILPHVTYNKTTDSYFMVYSLNDFGEYFDGSSPNNSGIYIIESKDGINWDQTPQQLLKGWSIPFDTTKPYLWHPNLIYSNNSQTEGYLVYSKSLNGVTVDGHKMYGRKFKITLN